MLKSVQNGQNKTQISTSRIQMEILCHHLPVCKALLKSGANPHFVNKRTNDSPLTLAVLQKDEDLCKVLVKYGADPSRSNKNNPSPLLIACLMNDNQILKVLISLREARGFSHQPSRFNTDVGFIPRS